MSSPIKTQVLVLGGGPGGYVAAIRAGQLGLSTVLVEADRLGGTCLIRGCIPSKAIIHAAAEYAAIRRAGPKNPLGIRRDGEVTLDFPQTMRWKDAIVDRLSTGIAGLLKRSKVRVEAGWGVFTDARTCVVSRANGASVTIVADHVILATGSEPISLPDLPWSADILSSTEALSLDCPPKRLAIVGAGYIGLEIGMALCKLGSKVTVVEASDRILPHYPAALTAPVAKAMVRQGMALHLAAKAVGYENGRLRAQVSGGDLIEIAADKVLVSVGRRPRTIGYGLGAMGVDMRDGFVAIDDQCRTSMAKVWAIGDLVGEPMLAHKASSQGEMVAECIAGARRRFDPVAIPAVCFTDPEIVTVGVCDPSAGVNSALFPLSANGRAMTLEDGDDGGFIQVLSAVEDGRLLGFTAVGRHVSELSGEMTALLEMGAVLEDAARIIHAHPTQSEMIQEAALLALGHPLHLSSPSF